MSFVRVKKEQAIKAEDLKGPETVSTGSLATTLTETNKILVEIQNQLAIDFANRIAEKKQTLKLSRKTGRKKKLGEKEEFVERGTKLQKSANAFGKKVLAPIKSIFDKLLDFLTIVGGGILLNAAWVWLQDEENREKLVKIFTFLKTYWKEILVGLLTLKVVSAIGKLVGFALTLRKLFKKLRGLGRRPPGAGGTRGINPPPGGGCGPVTGKGGCLDQLSATSQVAGNLAKTLFATAFAVNYFKRFQPAVKAPPQQKEAEQQAEETKELTPLEKIRRKAIPAEVQEYVGPLLQKYFSDLTIFGKTKTQSVQTPMGQLIVEPTSKNVFTGDQTPKFRFISKEEQDYKAQQTQLILDNPWIKTFFGAQTVLDYAGMVMAGRSGMGAKSKSPFTGLKSMNLSKFRTSIKNRLGQLQPKLPRRQVDRLVEASAKEAQSPAFHRSIGEKTKDGKLVVDQNVILDEALRRSVPRVLSGTSGTSKERKKLEQFRQTLEKSFANSPDRQPETQLRSMGGTIFGKGSQTVDSVPAMLAPGEEVIRSSASNIFRPVLKDINDNAGRMFIAFRDATNRMAKNNDLQADETSRSLTLFEKFKDLLDDQIQKIELEKFKEAAKNTLLVNGPGNNNTTGNAVLMSNTQQQSNATQNLLNQTQTEPQTPTLKVNLNVANSSLNQYNHRRSTTTTGGGPIPIETIHFPMPGTVVDARTPTQAQPEEQPTDSSSTDIIIAPVDVNNPFFGRSFSVYGVDFR